MQVGQMDKNAWQGYQPSIYKGSVFKSIGEAYRDAMESLQNKEFNNYVSPSMPNMAYQGQPGPMNNLDWLREQYRQARPY